MKKIKILRIIARLNIGGPAVHAILLTKWLNNDKFNSLLVTGVIGQNEGDMMYLAETNNIKPIIINELGREISWRDDIAAFYKILRLIIREKPDIIHTHTAKAGTLGRIAGIIYNILYPLFHPPLTKGGRGWWKKTYLVHTFHGHVFHSYFSPFKTKLFIYIERILAKFTHKIIAISNKQMNELSEKLKMSYSKKFEIIPLGLDLSSFYEIERYCGLFKKEIGLDEDVKLVGIIGRLVPVKNHRMFLDAVERYKGQGARGKGQEEKIKFVIIGDGELRKELEKYSTESVIAEDVIFTGWRKDLERVYADLDIVALTSLNEGTPVSIIEAMASGKPVIAAEVGGVRDLFKEGARGKGQGASINICDEGILVNSNDSDSLSEGIRFLMNNPEIAKDMGKKGRVFVKEKFSIERLVRDMEGMYERLMKIEN